MDGVMPSLKKLQRLVEEVAVAIPVEGARRLASFFDKRVGSRHLRIKAVHRGLDRRSNKFFVFVIYAPDGIPEFTYRFLEEVSGSENNLIVVANSALGDLDRGRLLSQAHVVIERENIGRDFGAYKDGVLFVLETYPVAERVVLANDSVFYFQEGLSELVQRLSGPEELIGANESYEYARHVQSFLLSFGKHAIRSRPFRKFWQGYRPLDSRQWAIMNGELALTRAMIQDGFEPHILFTPDALAAKLEEQPAEDARASIALLPPGQRKGTLATILGEKKDAALAIAENIKAHNQAHSGGFHFARYLKYPLMKRDLVFREIYPLEDVHAFLRSRGEPLAEDMIADLRKKGRGSDLSGLNGILFRSGML